MRIVAAEVLDQKERRFLDTGSFPLAALDDDDGRVKVLLLLTERHLREKFIHEQMIRLSVF